jgi:hypothetical protein
MILKVIWAIDRFRVFDLKTEQHSHNTQYLLSEIMEPLLAIFPDDQKSHPRRLSVHLDNCRIHRSKVGDTFLAENDGVREPHLPNCLGLAPADF